MAFGEEEQNMYEENRYEEKNLCGECALRDGTAFLSICIIEAIRVHYDHLFQPLLRRAHKISLPIEVLLEIEKTSLA